MQTISLNGDDWSFKEFTGEEWRWKKSHHRQTNDRYFWLEGSVPGSVQHDLWRNDQIPNPYFEKNTILSEWVPQRTWVYKKKFRIRPDLAGKRFQLCFKGVDFAAHFYLNDECLGFHEGMFTQVYFDVTNLINFDAENVLAVVLLPAPHEQPQVGYTSQVKTHKSRMGYWWDFNPRMVHLGIWNDVYLEVSGKLRIVDVFVRPILDSTQEKAQIELNYEFDSTAEMDVELSGLLQLEGQKIADWQQTIHANKGKTICRFSLEIDNPALWWPNGFGDQNLYQCSIEIKDQSGVSDHRSVTFGIRTIEFVQNEKSDSDALPYTLLVNGRKIYIKGWNWVPMDALYGVPRPQKLERLLTLARRANVNMLRLWGGGLIEKDSFYDICDRYGILNWQEFIQSSSGIENYPSDSPAFIELMTNETRQIIPTKRNHPALAIWCGGNELQSLDEKPLDDNHPLLSVLKQTVNQLDPDRYWLATSPTGRVFGNTVENISHDPTGMHDVHGPWEYQGTSKQYELYNRGCSLLHSEFGVEGITNAKTLDSVIHPDNQWPVSLEKNPLWYHLGAWWVKRDVWDEIFGELPDVESYIKATQFTQFDGLRYAVEADHRRMYQNSGTLPWQFNEPFPMAACTSAVDYFAQPKPVYYAVAKAYQPLTITARFEKITWNERETFTSDIWVSNSNLDEMPNAVLEERIVGKSGNVFFERIQSVQFCGNQSSQIAKVQTQLSDVQNVFFLDLVLKDSTGELMAENRYMFICDTRLTPMLHVDPTRISAQLELSNNEWKLRLENIGHHTGMYIWLEDARERSTPGFVYFDHNYFCLFPGESRCVQVDWMDIPAGERRLEIKGWNTNSLKINENGFLNG
jgi:beta-mannosidase